MKLQLFVLVLCTFKIATSTTTAANTTAPTTVAPTTVATTAAPTTAAPTTGNETSTEMSVTTQVPTGTSNNTSETTIASDTTASVPGGGGSNTGTIMAGTSEIVTGGGGTQGTTNPVTATTPVTATAPVTATTPVTAPAPVTATTKQTTPVPSTSLSGSEASSNTTEQDTTTVGSTTTMAGSEASSNTPEQDTTTVGSTTTMAASSTKTTEKDTTTVGSTTTMAATDPCSKSDVVQLCKDQNFTTCVTNGTGQYYCEGCLGGWTLKDGMCKKFRKVRALFNMTRIGGIDATFTDDLNNKSSDGFKEMEKTVCDLLLNATSANDCEVTSFSAGSIIADVVLSYAENADTNVTLISQQIEDGASSAGYLIATDSLSVTDVTFFCEQDSCLNEGVCEPGNDPINPTITCDCTGGFTGSNCSVSPKPDTTTIGGTAAAPSSGLATAVIIGIAIGCFLALLIIIVIIIVVVKNKGQNKIGSRGEMGRQEQREDEVPLQKR